VNVLKLRETTWSWTQQLKYAHRADIPDSNPGNHGKC